ncbi:DUF7510 family protein [Halegenticoccus tardaugens]|uniref:DUF7510 family protein n=1 Tax=Halegenticoccus tardaugens TaxID=2071624 RepID=UPI00100C3504|nr:hypothetical protein [Halegenticoccus tardaugens]
MTEELDCTAHVEDDRTEITVSGSREVAVVVRSASGERIYLPPEGFDRDLDADSPYQSARDDSPYQSASSDSPYQSARDDSPYQSLARSPGVTMTQGGFRIVHPEAVSEFQVFR